MFKSLESNILSNINPIIIKKKKKNFNILYNLRKNWQKIIGDKYFYFSYIKDLKINKENKKILNIEVYNPTISFLLSSEIDDIIENITIYYGYKVIDNIKFIQKPKNIELKQCKQSDIDQDSKEILNPFIENIADTELKELLLNLGAEVILKKNNSKN